MTRYLLIATAIVCVFVAAIGALQRRGPALEVRGGSAARGATPSPDRPDAGGASGSSPPFVGDAPWALSALPGCYAQLSARRDRLATLARLAPPVAEAAPPGSSIVTGECTLRIAARSVTVSRDDDFLRVPGVDRLYVARDPVHGDVLVLLRSGDGLPELRRYRLARASVLTVPGRGRVGLASKT